MSNQVRFIPGGEESENDSDYDEFSRPHRSKQNDFNFSQILGDEVKIIPKLGFQAGLNKNDFDITLDTNAENW